MTLMALPRWLPTCPQPPPLNGMRELPAQILRVHDERLQSSWRAYRLWPLWTES